MKSSIDFNKLKLKDLISGLCIKPTPFKLIETYDEDVSVETALKAFDNSKRKRKVIGVKTISNQVYHIGENEIKVILSRMQQQIE